MAPLFYKGQRVGSGSDADRWQIVRKLGEGAFAEVYECRDTFLAADSDARVSSTQAWWRLCWCAGQDGRAHTPLAPAHRARSAQFAMKVEKRLDCRSVRQEHRVSERTAPARVQCCPVGRAAGVCAARRPAGDEAHRRALPPDLPRAPRRNAAAGPLLHGAAGARPATQRALAHRGAANRMTLAGGDREERRPCGPPACSCWA